MNTAAVPRMSRGGFADMALNQLDSGFKACFLAALHRCNPECLIKHSVPTAQKVGLRKCRQGRWNDAKRFVNKRNSGGMVCWRGCWQPLDNRSGSF
jgi:hypothetical protein